MKRELLLPLWFWLFVAYLFVPLGIMALMGFRDGNFVAFPIQTWTSQWYLGIVEDADLIASLTVSGQVAIYSTAMALAIGLPLGMFVARLRGLWRAVLMVAVILPAFLPVIVSAIALRMFMGNVGLSPGIAAMSLGHAIGSVPFVVFMVLTRIGAMGPNLANAARDLGADEAIVFVRITLPFLAPALVGAFLFCVLLSFEDFARSFFLGGFDSTFPVLIFARLRFGFDPGVAAASTVVLVASMAIGLLAESYVRQRGLRA